MKLLALTLSTLCYCLAILTLLIRLRSAKAGSHSNSKTSFWVLSLIALLCHGFLLFNGVFIDGGLNLGVFKALSLVGWTIVLLILLTSIKKPIECISIVLFPLSIMTLLLDYFLLSDRIVLFGGSWQLQAHIFTSIAAYSFLTIAVVQAIILAVQDHHIHNRHPGGFIKVLPALQLMEQILFQIITLGFLLLTLGLLIGILFLEDITAQHLVHKTVLSIIAWGIFATLLWGRWHYGWRGRKAIRLALGGFLMLMLAFIGTKIVLELILNKTA